MLKIVKDPGTWYEKEGLRFECTGCGACCTGFSGFVWIEVEEMEAAAAYLNLSLDDFVERYIRKVGERYSLREIEPSYDCVFLKDKRCCIYEVRPAQCRTFPFWPALMKSREEWEQAAKSCEGIKLEV